MNVYKQYIFLPVFLCVILTACDSNNTEDATNEVRLFHKQYNEGSFNYIYNNMTSMSFKKATSQSDYISFMKKNAQLLGEYQFGRLIKEDKVQVLIGDNNVRLTLHSTYDNYELDELFVIKKENGKDKIQQIIYDMVHAVKITNRTQE
ncbi:hypothetical protein [Yokenella regensburgei]|uniref:Uncharacterized protein n=1 Tax=Yokenella regensburgei TaxID=158877 RepID=A0AB38FTG7_9ENTR|nr:hypothetical protein [Yokenella regensburgei]KFD19093.1 hypothetical protein GYRE_04636 [Yokenella regensburgei ATCC 49455]SQA60297.1 Uncharacterised protein [Yokenella regensburgei]SQA67608.1 Uncharacterised protein [Yokenella regensburgei]SQA95383.1 Uncharacterised protein [Yokenella regensburgei]SUQ05970.1 Uncharacterised protein [Yokenella regensburgei]